MKNFIKRAAVHELELAEERRIAEEKRQAKLAEIRARQAAIT